MRFIFRGFTRGILGIDTAIAVVLGALALSVACGPAASDSASIPPTAATGPVFLSTPTPKLEVESFAAGPCTMTRAAQIPIEFQFQGTIPTGFDGINQANCTFTKSVKTISVVLSGPAAHTEVFTLDPPTTEVSFPLAEGPLSISTLEIVPSGEYHREMIATSVDGETLVVSDQPGVLQTVTILESSR